MKNKLSDLRNHLFETIEKLKDGDMEVTKAKTIADVAQVIINSAKVEVDYLKATDQVQGTGFLDREPLPGQQPRLVKK
jgi:sortase (surface protein transpeptidase)